MIGYGQESFIDYIPTSSGKIHHETYYSFSYLDEHELSEWTIYLSTKARLLSPKIARRNNFKQNPNFKTTLNPNDYKGSGYDRGHLVPAADMAFDSVAMAENFYYTNTAPQTKSLNRGIWRKVENRVRALTLEYDSLIIITGCVLTDSSYSYPHKMGEISVPAYYYKIVADIKRNTSFGFVIPNYIKPEEKKLYTKPIDYVFSIDQIEELTGIDFFYLLPDDEERDLEDK